MVSISDSSEAPRAHGPSKRLFLDAHNHSSALWEFLMERKEYGVCEKASSQPRELSYTPDLRESDEPRTELSVVNKQVKST
jgi:hypothetical protein